MDILKKKNQVSEDELQKRLSALSPELQVALSCSECKFIERVFV